MHCCPELESVQLGWQNCEPHWHGRPVIMSAHEPWFGGGVFGGLHVADAPHKQGFLDWESVQDGPDCGCGEAGRIGFAGYQIGAFGS